MDDDIVLGDAFAFLYRENQDDFLAYLSEMEKQHGMTDPDLFQAKLKERPEYKGWKIKRMLKKPHQAMVQEGLELDVE